MSDHKEEEKFAPSNLLEGMVSIRALFDGIDAKINDRRPIEVWFASDRVHQKNGELRYLKARSYDLGYALRVVDPQQIEEATVGNSHGGIIAFCSGRTLPPVPENLPPQGFYVYLDGIEDPYNFGYALRSLYAAGADGILLPERNWMGAAGVVCRASAGASERFSLFCGDPQEMVKHFRNAGYQIVCADIKKSVSAYDADLKKPILLIVGGEKRGISRAILNLAHQIVRIDYGRDFQAALSAAAAAAILGFEVYRQNRSNKTGT